ncbi:MAG TPA: glycine--tRNA ligase subunit beta, partial [Bryobacteraceae bacterium]|nr:glycine--tRNA ligase subunit beta [Bryobacteraceae bacterium]
TPRRLVLRADGLLAAQPDDLKSVAGPPISAGQGAAQGFAKKMGVSLAEIQTVQTAKGEYYNFSKQVAGRRTSDVLADLLPGLITKLYFPKTMYWTGKGGPRFIRPIRWLVALLGASVVPFELAGVQSGSVTRGHRRLGSSAISVTVGDFEQQLKQNFVLLSAAERRARIEAGLDTRVRPDEALLKTLVYLTEFPTPIRGSFDPAYLELPQEILSTVMRHHQRYFSVEQDGKLAPEFVTIMNTSADPDGLVRMGNERVLRARFNDARFFWGVDQRRKLSERVEDLKNVTFQAKLGSYFDKTQRVRSLARQLAVQVGAAPADCERAALLSKTDLTTEMVKELTELQGIVGGLYAREQGEPEPVWRAIYEQYKPVSMEDSIPETLTGQVVALADKLDTLRGCFEIGMVPTGSKDPFALRRAAQGVVKILVEGKLPLGIQSLVAGNQALYEFLVDRIRFYFREVRGFKYDEVNAVIAGGVHDLPDAAERLEAVQSVRPTENFEPLAASFKRIQNILKQAQFNGDSGVNEALLEPGPEADLYHGFTGVREVVRTCREQHNYRAALESIASLRTAADLFFDKILVNAPDENVRRNRLALLAGLLTEFSAIADFSEIVTQSS